MSSTSVHVTTLKIKGPRESQVENKIRNDALTEIKIFLKDFLQQEGSELFLTAAKMRQLAPICKDPKIWNLLKDSSGLCACFLRDPAEPEPQLYPEGGTARSAPHQVSLP